MSVSRATGARVHHYSHMKVLASPKVCLLMNKKETWDEAHSSREGSQSCCTKHRETLSVQKSWQAKKVMNDTGFLQSLKDYDKARKNHSCFLNSSLLAGVSMAMLQ